jgi:hypothetical protein
LKSFICKASQKVLKLFRLRSLWGPIVMMLELRISNCLLATWRPECSCLGSWYTLIFSQKVLPWVNIFITNSIRF